MSVEEVVAAKMADKRKVEITLEDMWTRWRRSGTLCA